MGSREWGVGGDEGDKENNQCPMPYAPCPMPNAQCPMPNAQFPIITIMTTVH
ncbi:MAG: hypothetical protein V7L05_22705 [Nostoc sp.]|uniref:hypothetical protein n=1 Tax=Nostoc sp. TaxID=1180 RepID=UPI002FF69F53